MAKFGIALEWGSRGPEFESRHSDQRRKSSRFPPFFLFINLVYAEVRLASAFFHLLVRRSIACCEKTIQNAAFLSPVAHVWATVVFLGDSGGGMHMNSSIIMTICPDASGTDERRVDG